MTYQFHYQSPKYSYRYMALLFGGIIGLMVCVFVAPDFLWSIPWYIHLILFVLWIWAMRMNFKKIREESEKITMNEEGFTSALFGWINFENIQSYHISLFQAKTGLQAQSPTLCIKLYGEETIRFYLSTKHFQQDFPGYFDFVARFIVLMKNRIPEGYQKAQKKLDEYEVVIQHPKKYLKRFAGLSTVILVLGLGIARFMNSNPELFKGEDPALESIQNAGSHLEQEKKLLREAIAGEGSVFLLSNDTLVKTYLIPNMGKPRDNYAGGPAFEHIDGIQKIERFLAHKDSLGFHPVVDLGEKFIAQIPRIPVNKKSGLKYLYLTLWNIKGLDSTQKSTVVNWEIAYGSPSEIKDSLEACFPPFHPVVVHYLKTYPDCKLFITAYEGDGTELGDFKKASGEIKRLMQQYDLDTGNYHIKVNKPLEQ